MRSVPHPASLDSLDSGDDAAEGPGSDGGPTTRTAEVAPPPAPAKARGAVYESMPSFDELYANEWRYVAALVDRLLHRKADVPDVVQDVFLRAYNKLDQVETPAAIRGWLATMAVRAVSDRLRRKKWQQMFSLGQEQIENLHAQQASPEEQVEIRALYRALESLPVKERMAWTLRFVEQESLEDVAALCACSLATAKRRIAAAQEKLRERHGVE